MVAFSHAGESVFSKKVWGGRKSPEIVFPGPVYHIDTHLAPHIAVPVRCSLQGSEVT